MKNKNNIIIVIGIILVFLGSLLPSIRIAQENISFLKENGILMILLAAAMFSLYKINYRELLYIPCVLSLTIIIKFIIDNMGRLEQINIQYNCYAAYQYGLAVMILGNILILTIITMEIMNLKKIEKLLNKTKEITKTINIKTKAIIEKTKTNAKNIKEKILEKKLHATHETTKDGKIKFNKITVKCDKPKKIKQKKSIKQIIQTKRIKNKNLAISKYNDNKNQTYKTCEVPTINIQKWTQSNICCSNCGATVNSTSEYCFLCDCKIKLKQEKERIS